MATRRESMDTNQILVKGPVLVGVREPALMCCELQILPGEQLPEKCMEIH